MTFPVRVIDTSVPELIEQLGTKQKSWVRLEGDRYLFKIGRPGTGENWAEVIAARLASRLGIPPARSKSRTTDQEPDTMNTLYIAWQDPDTRMWHTVGRLTESSETGYRFCYTAGAEASPRFDYLSRMHDRFALRLEDGAAQPLGYCPRYLNQSLRAVLRETPIQLTVARNNHQAPIQFRLLCEARFPGKAGKRFYGSDEHRPLALPAAA